MKKKLKSFSQLDSRPLDLISSTSDVKRENSPKAEFIVSAKRADDHDPENSSLKTANSKDHPTAEELRRIQSSIERDRKLLFKQEEKIRNDQEQLRIKIALFQQEKEAHRTDSERLAIKNRDLRKEDIEIAKAYTELKKQQQSLADEASILDETRRSNEHQKHELLLKEKTLNERTRNCETLEQPLRKLESRIADLTAQLKEQKAIISSERTRNKILTQKLELSQNHSQEHLQRIAVFESLLNSGFSSKRLSEIASVSKGSGEKFPPRDFTILGEGPLDEAELIELLESQGCKAWDSGCTWIVLGRESWKELDLDKLLEIHTSETIKIISQEMLILSLLRGKDLFGLPKDALLSFATNHPGLQYLLETGFEWPFIDEEKLGKPRYFLSTGVQESPLTALGYHVGRSNGKTLIQRQTLLTCAFKLNLPWVDSNEYMEEWGEPKTRKRLWRIAHHLSKLVSSRESNPLMAKAVSDWMTDLSWLERTFYKPWMRFSWPNTNINTW